MNLTEPEFADAVDTNEIVLLDFWAEWCGPCKAYGPVYERVSEDFPDVVFAKIDTEAEPQLAQAFNMYVPSQPPSPSSKASASSSNPAPFQKMHLRDLGHETWNGLDMDEVRAEIQSQREAEGEEEPSNE